MLTPGLAELDNVVLLPHIPSVDTRGRMASMAAEDAVAFLRGRRGRHSVNPEVYESHAYKQRTTRSVEGREPRGLSTPAP